VLFKTHLPDRVNTPVNPEILFYIALGANLGDVQSNLRSAIDAISQLPETRLVRSSSLYRSAPLAASGPDYLNAVIAVKSRLDVHQLLLKLQQIENQQGRLRPFKNAPRTLDLDILLQGDTCVQTDTLQVPHPRMWERAFVLLPLAEIAPERVTTEQLAAVQNQSIVRLDESL